MGFREAHAKIMDQGRAGEPFAKWQDCGQGMPQYVGGCGNTVTCRHGPRECQQRPKRRQCWARSPTQSQKKKQPWKKCGLGICSSKLLSCATWTMVLAKGLEKAQGGLKGKGKGGKGGKGKGGNNQLAIKDKEEEEKEDEDEEKGEEELLKEAMKKAKGARDVCTSTLADFEDALGKATPYLSKMAKQNGLKEHQLLQARVTKLKDVLSKEKMSLERLKALLQEGANKLKDVKDTMKELKGLANKAGSKASSSKAKAK